MVKTGINQKKAAKEFAEKWLGRGDEKQDTQAFWTSLLRDVFGVVNPESNIFIVLSTYKMKFSNAASRIF